MINRELINATVQTYGGVDAYGQQLSTLQSTRTIDLAFGVLSHTDTTDIRYQDVTHYALTKDITVTDKDIITINNHDYKVKFVNTTNRWTQIYLCY